VKEGWRTESLADLSEVFADGDWIESKDQSPQGIRLIQTGNIGIGDFKNRADKARYISEATFKRLRCTEIFEGDCLISRLPEPVGRSCILPDIGSRMITGVDCTIVRFDQSRMLPQFFIYYSESQAYVAAVDSETTGTTRSRISRSRLGQTPTLVPPLSEQQRIVAILDDAFERIATATADVEKNIKNARAIFESHLDFVFTQRGDGWVDAALGEVCRIARGGSPRPIKDYLTVDPDGINWVKIADATASGKYIYETKERIIPDGARRSRMVHDGDFLLSNSMSFGHPYIMRTSGCIHDGWLVLTEYASRLNQDYLYYLLGSSFMYEQFDQLAAGSTVRNLNIELASRVEIPIPPLERQQEIARLFDAMSHEIERLQSIYQRKLDALDALKQSLLHHAFSGQL